MKGFFMNELEKIAIRLKHWIGHNLEHVKSYEEVALALNEMGLGNVSLKVEKAVSLSSEANRSFQAALDSIESALGKAADCHPAEDLRQTHASNGSHGHTHQHGDLGHHRHD